MVITANLSKITTAMRCFGAWARRRGLKPSETAYVVRARGRRALRFSKRGKPSIEEDILSATSASKARRALCRTRKLIGLRLWR